ncbi:MAG: type II glyceraldehyde-3-phosphate dehydrogenase [Fervidicoccaceae archaeon]
MVRVGVNGFGTIGKRIAEAIAAQDDMKLVGVAKTKPDYEALIARSRGYDIYVAGSKPEDFEERGIKVKGTLDDLLRSVDVIVDATPGGVGEKYKPIYAERGVRAVFQGGEKARVAEISFNSFCNYEEALGKSSIRVVSCNTTGLLRLLCTVARAFGLEKARAFIVRRGADPKEHARGPINSIVLDPPQVPSHHGLDVKSVMPGIDIVTAAIAVPTTLMHTHHVTLKLKRRVEKRDLVELFLETPRILVVSSEATSIISTGQLVEFFRDYGRRRYDVPELIVWEESIWVDGDEVSLTQSVHQESIVVPENVDAVRASTRLEVSAAASIEKTDRALGLKRGYLHEIA